MLYDRPVADLMTQALPDLPGRFKPTDIVDWFADHYPKVSPRTVRAHVIGLTLNDPSRRHYPSLARREPLLHRSAAGWLEPFDPDVHLDEVDALLVHPDESDNLDDVTEVAVATAPAEAQEFYLEAYLEEFLVTNWSLIDWRRPLRIWTDTTGRSGHQLQTPIGRLDLLCEDLENDALVVVELKRGMPSDRVVGQTARYMGWVAEHLADGRQVDGIIVAHEVDERLRYAVRAVAGLSLLVYEINFALRQPSE